jgi:membrane fusion protein, multidrug efflux system
VTRWLAIGVGVLALAGGLWLWHARSTGKPSGAAAAADPRASRPVPIIAATVERRDVPVFLDGLGSVVAYRTVTVRSQVDGRLDQVLFQEGLVVKKGQVLAQIDPRPFRIQLQTAEGALARDKAQLLNAKLNVGRDEQLVKGKLIAQQQLDADQATVGQLEGTVRIDEAAIAAARLNLDYSRITSPVEGVTGVRLVDPGNIVRAADQGGIVVVTQLDPIAVIFTVPQDELPRIVGQMRGTTKLTVQAYSRDGAKLLGTGQLELIDNQINQQTATLRLKAVFPNPERQLWPNQFVKARLVLATRRDALVVPATALQRGPSGTFVYVIGADQTVAVRPIEAEPPRGETAVIEKGLSAGEHVVADGQNQLRPGSKVMTREAGKGPPAGKGERGAGGGPGRGRGGAGKGPGGPATAPDGQRPR